MTQQSEKTNRYYALHSKIYDLTRWSFLFGRHQAVLDVIKHQPKRILEVGCGTGANIAQIAKALPHSTLYGLDASKDMLKVAQAKHQHPNLNWIHGLYPSEISSDTLKKTGGPFDCILFSYALTMFNPGWSQALSQAEKDLSEGGRIVLVDFDRSKHPWFKRWMAFNHVLMEGQLVEWSESNNRFSGQLQQKKAFGGLWDYFLYIGQKRSA